ncbi:MAG: ArnT family glycosyltransferase, partial [Patescibacteria group bacterium]
DEPALIRSVLGLRFDLNPHHFALPHFHFYFCYFFFQLLVKARAVLRFLALDGVTKSFFPLLWRDPSIFYLQMRLISAVMSAFAVVPIYLAAKQVFSRRVALLSAAIYAFSHCSVKHAHFALLEAPLLFWVGWVIYFSTLALKESTWKNYLAAGFFTGIATSTKYTGVFSSLAIFSAAIFSGQRKFSDLKDKVFKLFGSAVISVFAFLLGTPYFLLAWEEAFVPVGEEGYQHGFLWQISRGGSYFDSQALQRIWQAIVDFLPSLLGYVPLVLLLVSIFYLIFVSEAGVRKKGVKFLWFYPLITFLFLASGEFREIHYFLPIIPSLAIISAVGGDFLLSTVKSYFAGKERLVLQIVLVVCFLAGSFFSSSKRAYVFSQTDTRQLARDWVLENISKNTIVGVDGGTQPILNEFELVSIREWDSYLFKNKNMGAIIIAGKDLSRSDIQKGERQEVLEDYILAKKFEPDLKPGPSIFIFVQR